MIQNTKIRNESGHTVITLTEIKTILNEYYEQLYAKQLENSDKKIPRNTQTDTWIEKLNWPIITKVIDH